MNAKIKKAFTLMEMLVVVVLLGVLAAIVVPALMNNIEKTRDTSRKTQLASMMNALETYYINQGTYPLPDDAIEIVNNNGTLMYQGKVGTGVATKIGLDAVPLDPTDKEPYTYSMGNSSFGLVAYLESDPNQTAFSLPIPQVYAVDYENRYPYHRGLLGVLIDKDEKKPVNLMSDYINNNKIDLTNLSEELLIVKGTSQVEKEASNITLDDIGTSETVVNVGGGDGGSNSCVNTNISALEEYTDNYLDTYYVADNSNNIYCNCITDENIKQKCIDKKENGKYTTRFYPSVEFDNRDTNTEGAIYMLYAMNGKLEIEKKHFNNCSEDYSSGFFESITVFASLYREENGVERELDVEYIDSYDLGPDVEVEDQTWRLVYASGRRYSFWNDSDYHDECRVNVKISGIQVVSHHKCNVTDDGRSSGSNHPVRMNYRICYKLTQ